MSGTVRTVAAWEFRRWFKWRDQLVTLLIGAFSACVLGLVVSDRTAVDTVVVGVIGPLDGLPAEAGFTFVSLAGADHGYARAAPTAAGRDAVLDLGEREAPRLYVDRERGWIEELRALLGRRHLAEELSALGLDEVARSRLLDAPALELRVQRDPGHTTRRLVTAFLVLGLVLFALFLGMTYQFVAITGEKQQRVTELMLATVTPQQWIDGKIAGVTGLSAVFLVVYGLSALVFFCVAALFGVQLPFEVGFLGSSGLAWSLAFGLGGFLLWNTAFAAVAATISDPNTSARGGLLVLPVLPVALAALALKDPGAAWVQVCTLLPPTSWAFAPLRTVVAAVPAWQLVLALVLLYGSALGLRTFAGRVFEASVLLTGRDPSWAEIARFARSPRERG